MEKIEISQEKFPLRLQGTFGKFKTSTSYEVDFLLSSIPAIKAFDERHLKTFTEAFPFDQIDFDEMLQRDIDLKRVMEIKDKYLLSVGPRALFFPPLIVAVVGFDDKRPVNKFTHITRVYEGASNRINICFDDDRFQMSLFRTASDTQRKIILDNGKTENYLHYGAELQINPNKVCMVVLDGQHRFEALRKIYKDPHKRDELKEIEIPLCIVYTPLAGSTNAEEIIKDYREMFVRINKTAKVVSGHYLELLNDSSLSAIAVQTLAGKWKKTSLVAGVTDKAEYSKLQLLEWNQRDDKKADQRTKTYSITTVTILVEALREYCLEVERSRNKGRPALLMNLEAQKPLLEQGDSYFAINLIDDENFSSYQLDILRKIMDETIVSSLDCMFSDLSPYQLVMKKYIESVKVLEARAVTDDNCGAYIQTYLKEFKRPDRSPGVEPIMNVISNSFDEIAELEPGYKNYFLNVFQKGLIKTWIELSVRIIGDRTLPATPLSVAKALVAGLNAWAMDPSKEVFGKDTVYNMGVLFDGPRVIVSKGAINAWSSLMGVSLMNESSKEKFISELKKTDSSISDKNIEVILQAFYEANIESFMKEYIRSFESRLENGELYHEEIEEALIDKIDTLKKEIDETLDLIKKAEMEKEYDKIVSGISEKKKKEIRKKILARCKL